MMEQLARYAGTAVPAWKALRWSGMRFGVHIPTCIEGMMYPVPFAKPSDILPTALLCERLGFDSVWGNDHMTTQRYVQQEFPDPPNFFEPLMTFTYCASRTTAAPLRHRDHRAAHAQHAGARQAGGDARPALGGAGHPRRRHRGLPGGIRGALPRRPGACAGAPSWTRGCRRCACSSPSAGRRSGGARCISRRSSASRSRCRTRCRSTPGAIIRRSGAAPGSTRRAGCPRSCRRRRSSGGSPTSIAPRPRRAGTGRRSTSRRSSQCRSAAPTTRPSGASGPRSSSSTWSRSKRSTLREQTGGFDQRNLIGSPAEISERIRVYERAGVTTLSGMLFVASAVAEMHEAIELFGQEVLPNFRKSPWTRT